MNNYIVKETDVNKRLDMFLSSFLSISRSKIQSLIKSKHILVNNKNITSSYKLKLNDIISYQKKKKKQDFVPNSDIKIDIFLSNPPYVEKMEDIDENVKKYEPLDAIYVENGIEFYEYFFKNHRKFMKEHFMMGFEINYDQEEKLTELVEKYFDVEHTAYSFSKDFYGKTRFLFIFGGVVVEE